MSDEHIIKMTEQIGELNGTVKALSSSVEKFVEKSNDMHKDHYNCCQESKIDIGKINSRHSTYWKVIGSFGGLSAIGVFLTKLTGGQ